MPTDWSTTTLGECADFFSGGTPRKSNNDYWGGRIPWFSGKDLKSFYLSDSEDHVTEEGAQAGSRLIPAGTILLLVRGMTLHNDVPIGVLTREATFNQDIKALRARSGIQQSFLAHWLVSQKRRLLSTVHAAGHGTGVLATDRLHALELELPPPDEQAAIADTFDLIEHKIEQNRRTGRALERLARATFKAWFVDFEPVKAKAAGAAIFPGMPPAAFAAVPDRLVDSRIGPVPEGWEVRRLAEIMTLHYGKSLTKTKRQPGHVHVYGSGGVDGTHNEALVDGPGIVVGRKGSVGTIYWADTDFYPIDTTYYVQSTGYLRLPYLYELLKTLGLESMNTDAAVPGLNRENAYRLEIVVPQLAVVQAFDQFVGPIREMLRHLAVESSKLAALRDYLLPRLLSGRVRVRPPHANKEGAPA